MVVLKLDVVAKTLGLMEEVTFSGRMSRGDKIRTAVATVASERNDADNILNRLKGWPCSKIDLEGMLMAENDGGCV